MPKHKYRSLFNSINTLTLGSVFLLILVGSVVRSLGAGMGCPDWPKCFGQYIPPTDLSELPSNYLDIFKEERMAKNERVAGMFAKLGYGELAQRLISDPNILREEPFSVSKAWIEYINRLIGVLIGLFVFSNMIVSFFTKKRSLIILGISVFVLTGVQGWLGSLVVSTNLLKGFISFHLILALLIVALLIWMMVLGKHEETVRDKRLFAICGLSFLVFLPQILFGTEVRAIIDVLLVENTNRGAWHTFLSDIFRLHRSYSWLILAGGGLILYYTYKNGYRTLKPYALLLISLMVVAMLLGVTMVEFEFPFWAQSLHLLLATGIFSVLFYLNLRIRFS